MNRDNLMIGTVIVNPHPIVEMYIKPLEKDEVGYFAECVLYNKEFDKVESSFLIDEEKAEEIIELMQKFINHSKLNS